MTPLRIQRRRTKGWRMPKIGSNGLSVICVDRPSVWGNPFTVEEYGRALSIRLYIEMFYGWNPTLLAHLTDAEYSVAYQRQREWKARLENRPLEMAQLELRGHDLASWCPLCEVHKAGKPFDVVCADCAPCHADELGRACND